MNIKRTFFLLPALCSLISATASEITINLQQPDSARVISPEIYGQFAEHLGRGVYGGIWVGPESPIPNIDGYRRDVVEALKELHVPVLRWPGGCFADEYHWMDGIGPRENRPVMVNTNWGGTVEDNSFGTNEFFNLCELLGCEPYLSGNVGSGTVEELAKWVEYITADNGPMAELRRANGREKPWHLKYLGVGNESWGCGGNFTPEYYADVYRRYQTYCRNYGDNRLLKIASGASDYDYNWTEVLMKKAGGRMRGISLHYYTCTGWPVSGHALDFTTDDYYWTLGKCLEIEPVIKEHCRIMDRYDRSKRVGLLVDEWGTWWLEEPGTVRGHLYQQNTMRDAMVAALSLNVFHRFADRVRMANIAQMVNVLQAMILTSEEGRGAMVLTPTYYVFKMYVPHQGATFVPLTLNTPYRYVRDNRQVPQVSATASVKDGRMALSVANTDLDEPAEITIPVPSAYRRAKGELLCASSGAGIADHNDFDHPDRVKPRPFKDLKLSSGRLTFTLPAGAITTIVLE